MMDGWDGGMAAWAWILMVIFWGVLVAVIVWAVASLFPGRSARDQAPRERPEEILDGRLARGEIDTATYDELQAKLSLARGARR